MPISVVGDDSEEHRALDLPRHQHAGDQNADQRERRTAGQNRAQIGKVGGFYRTRRFVNNRTNKRNDIRIQQADEADEQTDTGADRSLQRRRNGGDNLRTNRRNLQ